MIILGVDPGSLQTGFAVLEWNKKKIKYLASGTLKFSKFGNFLDRIGPIYNESISLVEKYQPDEIALESLIYVKSPTALIKLAQARGSLCAAFSKTHAGRIFEYSPNLVKSTAVGHGHASKESIQKFLKLLVNKDSFETFDESDALAVAVCHALSRSDKGEAIRVKGKGRGMSKSLAHEIRKEI